MNALLVFVGGGLGATLRFGVNRLALGAFPVETMIVNVVGSAIAR